MFETIAWSEAGVVMLDQRRLPVEEIYLTCEQPEAVADAIRGMVIRGAPAIGIAAAMGIALGAQHLAGTAGSGAGGPATGGSEVGEKLRALCDLFAATRPTAVNLFWAIDRMKRALLDVAGGTPSAIADRLLDEALKIKADDIASCRAIGENLNRDTGTA